MLTVLMATYNGASTLPMVLASFLDLEQPPGGWTLVIVDNGSSDATISLVASFVNRLPLVQLGEARPGKNAALNTGLPHAAGDLIVFTDDDAIPRRDWLVRMRAVADRQPEFSVFGGAIVPRWETQPPQWVLQSVPLDSTFTLTDPTLPEGPVSPSRVFGPNMAVRATVLGLGYRFDERIGPRRGSYPMGSETELLHRIERAGFRCWFHRDAVVEHFIRSWQFDRRWVLRRAFRAGRGQHRLQNDPLRASVATLFGMPRYFVPLVGAQALKVARASMSGDRPKVLREKIELSSLLGQAVEARLLLIEQRQGVDAAGPVRIK